MRASSDKYGIPTRSCMVQSLNETNAAFVKGTGNGRPAARCVAHADVAAGSTRQPSSSPSSPVPPPLPTTPPLSADDAAQTPNKHKPCAAGTLVTRRARGATGPNTGFGNTANAGNANATVPYNVPTTLSTRAEVEAARAPTPRIASATAATLAPVAASTARAVGDGLSASTAAVVWNQEVLDVHVVWWSAPPTARAGPRMIRALSRGERLDGARGERKNDCFYAVKFVLLNECDDDKDHLLRRRNARSVPGRMRRRQRPFTTATQSTKFQRAFIITQCQSEFKLASSSRLQTLNEETSKESLPRTNSSGTDTAAAAAVYPLRVHTSSVALTVEQGSREKPKVKHKSKRRCVKAKRRCAPGGTSTIFEAESRKELWRYLKFENDPRLESQGGREVGARPSSSRVMP
ncbi:hypothetical protein C8R45DRAFT_1083431 [Mycena sanguinolenta]|nr:hypothetical protein C8R45DRAFT_1083431 [Mycena sanguinolenta]